MSISAIRNGAQHFISALIDTKLSTLCKHQLLEGDYKIDLSHMSEYPAEEERLIAPYESFTVKKIKRKHNFIEIKLKLNILLK